MFVWGLAGKSAPQSSWGGSVWKSPRVDSGAEFPPRPPWKCVRCGHVGPQRASGTTARCNPHQDHGGPRSLSEKPVLGGCGTELGLDEVLWHG